MNNSTILKQNYSGAFLVASFHKVGGLAWNSVILPVKIWK